MDGLVEQYLAGSRDRGEPAVLVPAPSRARRLQPDTHPRHGDRLEACALTWLKLVRRADVALDTRGFSWPATIAVHEARQARAAGPEIPSGTSRPTVMTSTSYVTRPGLPASPSIWSSPPSSTVGPGSVMSLVKPRTRLRRAKMTLARWLARSRDGERAPRDPAAGDRQRRRLSVAIRRYAGGLRSPDNARTALVPRRPQTERRFWSPGCATRAGTSGTVEHERLVRGERSPVDWTGLTAGTVAMPVPKHHRRPAHASADPFNPCRVALADGADNCADGGGDRHRERPPATTLMVAGGRGAPPSRARRSPSTARAMSMTVTMTTPRADAGASGAERSGSAAPTENDKAEADAACGGRASRCSSSPSSSRRCTASPPRCDSVRATSSARAGGRPLC
jgi:hypothetical protein